MRNGVGKQIELGGIKKYGYFKNDKFHKEIKKLEPNLIETLILNKRSIETSSNTIFNFKHLKNMTPLNQTSNTSSISPKPYPSVSYKTKISKHRVRSLTPAPIK